jgi:hypothetical protein
MSTHEPIALPEKADSTVSIEQLVEHLMRNPFDIIDTTRLMRRFHVSAEDLRAALDRFSTLMIDEEEQ